MRVPHDIVKCSKDDENYGKTVAVRDMSFVLQRGFMVLLDRMAQGKVRYYK